MITFRTQFGHPQILRFYIISKNLFDGVGMIALVPIYKLTSINVIPN